MKSKKNWWIMTATWCLTSMLLSSCGTESGRFRLEGRLRNMNQGEFWVYSTDGGLDGIDTIQVRSGRFAYEVDVPRRSTLVVVFPNYSEQAVFAESGSTVTMKGDATHLKEITIEGTDDNGLMTKLRKELNRLSPPDIPGAVEKFIRDYPESAVSVYLLQRYFVLSHEPDFRKAQQLTTLLLKEQPDNGDLLHLKKQLKGMQGAPLNGLMPKFKTMDVQGKPLTDASMRSTLNVVYTWATWSFRSIALQNRLMKLKREYGNEVSVLGICLDADVKVCKRRISSDSLKWSTVCDGRIWETPLLATFSLCDVPANVVIDKKGRIIARNVAAEDLEKRAKEWLKQ